jgi:hypothetical protein
MRERWELHERLACARVLGRIATEPRDRSLVVAAALRGLAELLLDAQRWDHAELVRSCARALER